MESNSANSDMRKMLDTLVAGYLGRQKVIFQFMLMLNIMKSISIYFDLIFLIISIYSILHILHVFLSNRIDVSSPHPCFVTHNNSFHL